MRKVTRAIALMLIPTAWFGFASPAWADPDDESSPSGGPDNSTSEVCTAFNLGVPGSEIPGRLGANDGRLPYWVAQQKTAWPILNGECG